MEKTAHTVHRLEAFSDIVMGFCLAQLGANLVLPKAAGDTQSVWASATFFVAAFIFIALLWWLHHRTFSTYFVLSLPMVILNFGMLCGLILTLYLFESVAHVAAIGQKPGAIFTFFVVSFAVTYALLGVMLLVGLIVRRNELSPDELRWGIGQLVSIAMAGPAAAGTLALSERSASLAYVTIALVAVIFVLRRVVLPRLLSRLVLPKLS